MCISKFIEKERSDVNRQGLDIIFWGLIMITFVLLLYCLYDFILGALPTFIALIILWKLMWKNNCIAVKELKARGEWKKDGAN